MLFTSLYLGATCFVAHYGSQSIDTSLIDVFQIFLLLKLVKKLILWQWTTRRSNFLSDYSFLWLTINHPEPISISRCFFFFLWQPPLERLLSEFVSLQFVIRHPWRGGFKFLLKVYFLDKRKISFLRSDVFVRWKNRFRTFMQPRFVKPDANANFRPSSRRRPRVASNYIIWRTSDEISFFGRVWINNNARDRWDDKNGRMDVRIGFPVEIADFGNHSM